MASTTLSSRRVLVVEDDYFLATEMERELQAAGAIVLGPVPRVETALDLIAAGAKPDVAVLDVNLASEMVFPVAEDLERRGVPFVFTTGYVGGDVSSMFARAPRFEKPVDLRRLVRTLAALLGGAA